MVTKDLFNIMENSNNTIKQKEMAIKASQYYKINGFNNVGEMISFMKTDDFHNLMFTKYDGRTIYPSLYIGEFFNVLNSDIEISNDELNFILNLKNGDNEIMMSFENSNQQLGKENFLSLVEYLNTNISLENYKLLRTNDFFDKYNNPFLNLKIKKTISLKEFELKMAVLLYEVENGNDLIDKEKIFSYYNTSKILHHLFIDKEKINIEEKDVFLQYMNKIKEHIPHVDELIFNHLSQLQSTFNFVYDEFKFVWGEINHHWENGKYFEKIDESFIDLDVQKLLPSIKEKYDFIHYLKQNVNNGDFTLDDFKKLEKENKYFKVDEIINKNILGHFSFIHFYLKERIIKIEILDYIINNYDIFNGVTNEFVESPYQCFLNQLYTRDNQTNNLILNSLLNKEPNVLLMNYSENQIKNTSSRIGSYANEKTVIHKITSNYQKFISKNTFINDRVEDIQQDLLNSNENQINKDLNIFNLLKNHGIFLNQNLEQPSFFNNGSYVSKTNIYHDKNYLKFLFNSEPYKNLNNDSYTIDLVRYINLIKDGYINLDYYLSEKEKFDDIKFVLSQSRKKINYNDFQNFLSILNKNDMEYQDSNGENIFFHFFRNTNILNKTLIKKIFDNNDELIDYFLMTDNYKDTAMEILFRIQKINVINNSKYISKFLDNEKCSKEIKNKLFDLFINKTNNTQPNLILDFISDFKIDLNYMNLKEIEDYLEPILEKNDFVNDLDGVINLLTYIYNNSTEDNLFLKNTNEESKSKFNFNNKYNLFFELLKKVNNKDSDLNILLLDIVNDFISKYGFENFINNNFKFMQFLSENHDDFISELLINNNFNTNYKKFFNKIINEYDSENNISIGSHNKSKGNVLPVDLITFFQNINLLFKDNLYQNDMTNKFKFIIDNNSDLIDIFTSFLTNKSGNNNNLLRDNFNFYISKSNNLINNLNMSLNKLPEIKNGLKITMSNAFTYLMINSKMEEKKCFSFLSTLLNNNDEAISRYLSETYNHYILHNNDNKIFLENFMLLKKEFKNSQIPKKNIIKKNGIRI